MQKYDSPKIDSLDKNQESNNVKSNTNTARNSFEVPQSGAYDNSNYGDSCTEGQLASSNDLSNIEGVKKVLSGPVISFKDLDPGRREEVIEAVVKVLLEFFAIPASNRPGVADIAGYLHLYFGDINANRDIKSDLKEYSANPDKQLSDTQKNVISSFVRYLEDDREVSGLLLSYDIFDSSHNRLVYSKATPDAIREARGYAAFEDFVSKLEEISYSYGNSDWVAENYAKKIPYQFKIINTETNHGWDYVVIHSEPKELLQDSNKFTSSNSVTVEPMVQNHLDPV